MSQLLSIARDPRLRTMTAQDRRVIVASSVGTVFEWYDFFLYGSLAGVIGAKFFSQFDPAVRDIFALLAFAAGFVVRPFGALVFGRLGDLVGRKRMFLVTILMMGVSTFLVGLLPDSDTIGIAAPVLLIILRLVQGLALGGEYGGAATYVGEQAPQGRRGFYTSWIQTTLTVGFFLSLIVILITRSTIGEAEFARWGWRVPFLISAILLVISIGIRLKLNESPAFQAMKEHGTLSKGPLTEAFGTRANAKVALLALFGLTMGQGVLLYAGPFYSLFFLQSILKVDGFTASLLIAYSLLLGSAGFVFFGWLSDRVGRKPIILTGCAIAALTYFPIFDKLTEQANPALYVAQSYIPVVIRADPADCNFQFNPVGTAVYTTSCDIAAQLLASLSIPYSREDAPTGTIATIRAGEGESVESFNAAALGPRATAAQMNLNRFTVAALVSAGYPETVNQSTVKMKSLFDIGDARTLKIIGLLTLLVIYVAMAYGPIAAALVELFPSRIRYSAMSLPYHIGNGWFGGLLPATSFAIVTATGKLYSGLWYPIVFATITVVVGVLFLPETKDRDIFANDGTEGAAVAE